MIRFLISRFISKDKALELLGEHEEKITEFTEKNKHLSSAVKTGFKIWSMWKLILIIWWGFVICLFLGGAYILYIVISKFL